MRKRATELFQKHANQENLLHGALDTKALLKACVSELKEGLRDRLSLKELKALAGNSRLRFVIVKYLECIENEQFADAEKWAQKIEEYCIPKPKEITGHFEGDPTWFLPERLAILNAAVSEAIQHVRDVSQISEIKPRLMETLGQKLLK